MRISSSVVLVACIASCATHPVVVAGSSIAAAPAEAHATSVALVVMPSIAGRSEQVPDPAPVAYQLRLHNAVSVEVDIPMLRTRRLPMRDDYDAPIAITAVWEQDGVVRTLAIVTFQPPHPDGPLVQVATVIVPMPGDGVTERLEPATQRHVYSAPDPSRPFDLWLLGSSRHYDARGDNLSPRGHLSVLHGYRIVPGAGVTQPSSPIAADVIAMAESEGMPYYESDLDRYTETEICALTLDPRAPAWLEAEHRADTMSATFFEGTAYYDEAQAAAGARPLTAAERRRADHRADAAASNAEAIRKEGDRERDRQQTRLDRMARKFRPGCLTALLPVSVRSLALLR
jgi:hypothetical protein